MSSVSRIEKKTLGTDLLLAPALRRAPDYLRETASALSKHADKSSDAKLSSSSKTRIMIKGSKDEQVDRISLPNIAEVQMVRLRRGQSPALRVW